MNYFDYIILAVLTVGFILGFKDGMVRKIIGLLGIVIGIIVAIKYSGFIGSLISPIFNDEIYLAEIVAGFLIFVGIIFIASLIKRIIHPSDKVNKFLNQFLGGITGAIQILVFLSAFLLFLDIFSIPSSQVRDESLLYGKVYSIIPGAIDLIAGENENSRQFIKKYIEAKDTASFIQEKDTTITSEKDDDSKGNTR